MADHLLDQPHGIFSEKRFVTLFADYGRDLVYDQVVAVSVDRVAGRPGLQPALAMGTVHSGAGYLESSSSCV